MDSMFCTGMYLRGTFDTMVIIDSEQHENTVMQNTVRAYVNTAATERSCQLVTIADSYSRGPGF